MDFIQEKLMQKESENIVAETALEILDNVAYETNTHPDDLIFEYGLEKAAEYLDEFAKEAVDVPWKTLNKNTRSTRKLQPVDYALANLKVMNRPAPARVGPTVKTQNPSHGQMGSMGSSLLKAKMKLKAIPSIVGSAIDSIFRAPDLSGSGGVGVRSKASLFVHPDNKQNTGKPIMDFLRYNRRPIGAAAVGAGLIGAAYGIKKYLEKKKRGVKVAAEIDWKGINNKNKNPKANNYKNRSQYEKYKADVIKYRTTLPGYGVEKGTPTVANPNPSKGEMGWLGSNALKAKMYLKNLPGQAKGLASEYFDAPDLPGSGGAPTRSKASLFIHPDNKQDTGRPIMDFLRYNKRPIGAAVIGTGLVGAAYGIKKYLDKKKETTKQASGSYADSLVAMAKEKLYAQ